MPAGQPRFETTRLFAAVLRVPAVNASPRIARCWLPCRATFFAAGGGRHSSATAGQTGRTGTYFAHASRLVRGARRGEPQSEHDNPKPRTAHPNQRCNRRAYAAKGGAGGPGALSRKSCVVEAWWMAHLGTVAWLCASRCHACMCPTSPPGQEHIDPMSTVRTRVIPARCPLAEADRRGCGLRGVGQALPDHAGRAALPITTAPARAIVPPTVQPGKPLQPLAAAVRAGRPETLFPPPSETQFCARRSLPLAPPCDCPDPFLPAAATPNLPAAPLAPARPLLETPAVGDEPSAH
jgi:hypothetical protein